MHGGLHEGRLHVLRLPGRHPGLLLLLLLSSALADLARIDELRKAPGDHSSGAFFARGE